MMALMWDDRRGYFFDYDFMNRKRSTYISATGLYPLWAKMLDAHDPADRERVARMVSFMSEKLEEPAGLAASAKESVASARHHDPRQWDYPYGWPPHQMLAWQGLKNYGLDAEAGRLAYRWLYTIAKNAHDYNGVIPEKYNVVTGSHEVFVEYGNVGTKFAVYRAGRFRLDERLVRGRIDLSLIQPTRGPARVETGGAGQSIQLTPAEFVLHRCRYCITIIS